MLRQWPCSDLMLYVFQYNTVIGTFNTYSDTLYKFEEKSFSNPPFCQEKEHIIMAEWTYRNKSFVFSLIK